MGAGAGVFSSRILMFKMMHICFRFNSYSLIREYPWINFHANLNSTVMCIILPLLIVETYTLCPQRVMQVKLHFLSFASVSALLRTNSWWNGVDTLQKNLDIWEFHELFPEFSSPVYHPSPKYMPVFCCLNKNYNVGMLPVQLL